MPRSAFSVILSLTGLVLLTSCAFSSVDVAAPNLEADLLGPLPGLPFEHYQAQRADGPPLDFYIAATERAAPLLLVIQGSGCSSAFGTNSDGSMFGTLAQDTIFGMAKERFTVLAVDKPGVEPGKFLEGGEMDECTDYTRSNHTLDNWTHTLSLAIDIAKSLKLVAHDEPIRILGISEGAVSAARLSAMRPDISHITYISGFGCVLMDDMIALAQRDWRRANADLSPEALQAGNDAAATDILDEFRQVFATPEATDILVQGQTPKFWSSVGFACPAADMALTDAEVFVAVGLEDKSLIAEGVEEIVIRRLQQGKETKITRVVGGNHGLGIATDENPFGRLIATFEEAIDWMAQ